jgi:hypothetical protein
MKLFVTLFAGSVFFEHLRGRSASRLARNGQRRLASARSGVNIDSVLQEKLQREQIAVLAHDGVVNGIQVVNVGQVHVDAVPHKQLAQIHVAARQCPRQRAEKTETLKLQIQIHKRFSLAVMLVLCVHICAQLQQLLDNVRVSATRRQHNRRRSVIVLKRTEEVKVVALQKQLT